MIDKLTAEIRAVLGDFYQAGRQQVADELARQRRGEPVVQRTIDDRQGQATTLAEPRLTKRQLSDALAEHAEVLARTVANAALTAAAQQALRVAVDEIAAEALAELVTRASDEAAIRAGSWVANAMQAGRADKAEESKEAITRAVYSAILDENTCDACAERDFDETTDLDEAATWTPNPECAGGERCRCITIYEYAGGE
jgi:hypothetical protein